MTLSSSKTLAFVSLPSFPINKFPRAARANWPRRPESGREQAVPRLSSSERAPGTGGFHASRAATDRDRASWACRDARDASDPDFHGSANPRSAARPRRPLRPGRSPPPGAGPARPGLRAPPPGLATTLRPGPGRLGSRPRGGRPRAYLSARGSSSRCCLGSRTALAARAPGGAGCRAASEASVELRPERAPPSSLPVPSSPWSPPSAAGSAPRPARTPGPAPRGPRPHSSAHRPPGMGRPGAPPEPRRRSLWVQSPLRHILGGAILSAYYLKDASLSDLL